MSNRELKKRLTEYFEHSMETEINIAHMEETIKLCVATMREQPAPAEPRQSFWGFLSDVFHFEGISLLLSQSIILLLTSLAICSLSMDPRELPMYMPFFILAVVPIFFRGQRYRVSEVEAATRTSGAQLALARLILAGGATLVCVTLLLGLEVRLQRSCENLGQMVLYCLVPYLTCMTAMLALIRKRRKDGISISIAIVLGSFVFWWCSSRLFPWLYEASAVGIWIVAVLAYSVLFTKEIVYIIHANKKVNMYGIVG